MSNILSGPSRPPAIPGKPQQLVVFLHGYGADGNDLIGLAPLFAQALPYAEFVAPNAPEKCLMGFGYQWFGLTDLNPASMVAGIAKARPLLDAFLDDALASRGLAADNLAIIGFSQGTMMALDLAVRRADSAAAIVGFSGLLAGPATPLAQDAKRPHILLVHGDADPVVPFARLTQAEAALTAAGFPVEIMGRPGLGHGIDPEGMQKAAAFLAQFLTGSNR
jgi:phospholipase/carboxylesterase